MSSKRHRKVRPEKADAASSRLVFEALEPRILFSATPFEIPDGTVEDTQGPQLVQEEQIFDSTIPGDSVKSAPGVREDGILEELNRLAADLEGTGRIELVFVAGGFLDEVHLVQHLDPIYEVRVIDAGSDGIRQMTEAVAGRSGIDAIHLIAPGDEARLHLGTAAIDPSSMDGIQGEMLVQIGSALSGDANIVVYGCSFGTGEAGQAAARQLGTLMGAEVAVPVLQAGRTGLVGDWLPASGDQLLSEPEPGDAVGRFTVFGLDRLDEQGRERFLGAVAGLESSLSGLPHDESGASIIRETFGNVGRDPEAFDAAVRSFLDSLKDDGFSMTIDLRDGEDLNGAFGAYAEVGHDGSERTYINADWINSGAGGEWIEQVLLEEAGHAIDTRLNPGSDSTGDEGEIFAARILGWSLDPQLRSMRADWDHGTLVIDGRGVNVQFASYTFGNAYALHTQPFAGDTFLAEKEQNRHYFVAESLNITRINDMISSRYFSGNDVVVQMTIGDSAYDGWISRPIKVGGIVRGFYFWSDNDFSNLADAAADGNTDGDRNAGDNFGFILVVDQAYFDSLPSQGATDDGKVIKFIGSSSDRVDSALNSLIGPNIAPSPMNDVRTVSEDSSDNTGNVLTNDVDANLDALTVTGFSIGGVAGTLGSPFTIVGAGSFTLSANGDYSFTPLANYAGPVPEVTYTVSDGEFGASATLSFTITPVNDAPLAVADAAAAYEAGGCSNGTAGRGATGNVLTNDSDIDDGDSIRVSQVEAGGAVASGASSVAEGSTSDSGGTDVTGSYGSFTIGADGSFIYLVNESNADVQALNVGETLTETFSYTLRDASGATATATVTVTIQGVDDAPAIAAPTSSYTVAEGASVTLGGVSVADPDDSSLSLSLSVNSGVLTLGATAGLTFSGSNGTASFTISGSKSDINAALATLVYQGSSEFSGTDTLVLEAADPGGLSACQAVEIVVTPDDRALTVSGSTVNEASPFVVFQVAGAAGQKAALELANTGYGAGHATLGADELPNLEYFDGSSWDAYAGQPVSIPAGGILLVRAAVLQDATFEGAETLHLHAVNKAGTVATGTSTIADDGTGAVYVGGNATGIPNVSGDPGYPSALDDDRNSPPVAVGDSFSVTENGSVTIDVLPDDSDPEDDPLAIIAVNGTPVLEGEAVAVTNGAVKLEGGKLIYTPAADYFGPASFTYTISDGAYASTATVSGTVDALARTVTITDASRSENGDITFTATLNRAVPGGFSVTVAAISGTAISGEDYSAFSRVLTFAGTGGEVVLFTVNLADDDLIERDETFTLVMSNLSIGGVDISDSATGTIIDNDARLAPAAPGEGVTTDVELVADGSGGFDLVIEDVETDSPIGFLSDVPVSDSSDNLLIYRDGSDYVIRDLNGLWLGSPIVGATREAVNEIRVPVALVTGSIILRTGAGDDVVTLRDLGANLSGSLVVDLEDGSGRYLDSDTINYDSSTALATGGSAQFRAETINGLEDSLLNASGAGEIEWDAGRNIVMKGGSRLRSESGAITLEANVDGVATGRYRGILLEGAELESQSGTVRLEGRGGTQQDRNFGVNATDGSLIETGGRVEVIGTGGGDGATTAQHGVLISASELRSSGAQGVTMRGEGGAGSPGVTIEKSSVIDAGNGDLGIWGTGGGSESNNYGVSVAGSELGSAGGNIELNGTGRGVNAGIGVRLANASAATNGEGAIVIRGTGASGFSGNDGVLFHGGTTVSAEDGDILIEGTASGTVARNIGVSIMGGSLVDTSSGDGNLTVRGTGGFGSGGVGVMLNSGGVLVSEGDLTLRGTGRGAAYGTGVELAMATLQSSGSGTIDVEGAGSSTGTGSHNAGIYGNASRIVASGNGSIELRGTGGGGLSSNDGVQLSATRVEGAASIVIGGIAGGAAGSSSGVALERGTAVAGAGNASVAIDGTGSSVAAAGRYHRGVEVVGSTVSTVNGALALRGTGGGAGTGTLNHGIDLLSGAVQSTGSGNVVLVGRGARSGTGINVSKSSVTSASGNISATGNGGAGAKNVRGISIVRSTLRSSGGGDITARGTAHPNTTGIGNVGAYLEFGTLGSSGQFRVFGTGGGGVGRNHGVFMNKITRAGSAIAAFGVKIDGHAKSFPTAGDYFA